jgi:thymidylate synthase ThyX
VLKYALIDAWMTTDVMTINASALRNVFRTRLGKGVLPEYRALAWGMWGCLPMSHRVLFADVVEHVLQRDGTGVLPPCMGELRAWKASVAADLVVRDADQ